MIDDKKTDEAAREAADLYEQDLPIMSYNEDTEVDGQHHFCQEFGAKLFKDGAKWAINEFLKDLWHPASEEPERDRDILLEYENGHPSDARMRLPYQYENIYSDLCKKYWSVMVKIEKITRWLYIDDLLKGRRHS